jgi:hypothetical protein
MTIAPITKATSQVKGESKNNSALDSMKNIV